MKTQSPVVQPARAEEKSGPSKSYAPVSLDGPVIDVEAVVSGVVLFGMLGFICLLFVGCFDVGLIA